MRIGSLFSGAGGLDLAVEEVFGGEIVWHAEIDKAASKVLAYRFPGVPNLGDITQVDWADVPAVDVLCGGFPCQDVSAAGKRAGIKQGTRSGLWSVFADAIDALRPQWVVVENVRGLLSATAQRTVDDAGDSLESGAGVVGDGAGRPVLRAIGAVLGDLCDLGYDAQWATVAAADVGAPHRRERVFVLAADPKAGQHADNQLARGDGAELTVTGGDSHRSAPTAADACGDGCGGCAECDLKPPAELAAPQRDDADRRVLADGRNLGCAGASHTARDGWDEGRPESARLVGGFDAAVSGNEPGLIECIWCRRLIQAGTETTHQCGASDTEKPVMLPTPRATDGTDGPVTNCPSVQAICDGSAGRAPRLSEMAAGGLFGDEPGVALLPTPGTLDSVEKRTTHAGGNLTLQGAVVGVNPVDVERHAAAGRKVAGDGVALLPTPCVVDRLATTDMTLEQWDESRRSQKERGVSPSDLQRHSPGLGAVTAHFLLPTPEAKNGHAGPDYARMSREGSGGHDLVTAISLLPTPTTEPQTGNGHARNLGHEVKPAQWGKYAPAIRRWEAIVGPAPAPTEPNKNGNPRLSAAFSEWLMGWPAGWVTDPAIGISRNDQLRIVGNGVCPQQAAQALRFLLAIATNTLEIIVRAGL